MRKHAPIVAALCVLSAPCCSPPPADPAGPADAPVDAGPADAPVDAGPDASQTDEPPGTWVLTEVGLEAGVQDRLGHQKGAAVADFDGDGYLDLFLTNPGAEPVMFFNQRDGTFTSNLEVPHTVADWGPVVWDYDADGDPDLFIFCGGRGLPCYDLALRLDGVDPETGDPVFTDVTAESGLGAFARASFGAALADYDGDGDVDIFVPVHRRAGFIFGTPDIGDDMLLRNNGDGTFTNVADEAGVANPGASAPSAWLDYDRDGDPDLYIPILHGENILYRNEGDGTFTDVTPEPMRWPHGAYGAIAQDFDNDGWVDLLISEYYQPDIDDEDDLAMVLEGPPGDRLFRNEEGGGWTDVTELSGLVVVDGDAVTPRSGTMGYQVGDLDLDGFMDVLYGNGSPRTHGGQLNRLVSAGFDDSGALCWHERGDLLDVPAAEDGAVPAYPSYPYRTHGSLFFDFDNDDDVDLFVGNGGHPPAQEEPNQLFRNDSAPVHGWVKLRLRAAGQNIWGVGALVRVADAPGDAATWQVSRLNSGTTGFNASEHGLVQVGTGLHEGPYAVTVRWPGGGETTVEGVEARTTLEIAQD